jgi:hypothetical protein
MILAVKCLKFKVPIYPACSGEMPKIKENAVQLLAGAMSSDLAGKTRFLRLEYGY